MQRKANPLVGSINARGAVRTVRIDRIVRLKDTAEDGLGFDNDRVKGNRMPDALPQAGMAMPDAAPVRTLDTDRLLREYEENQGYLGLSTMGMREGRQVKGGAAETRRLLARNTEISQELDARGVKTEDAQLQRALARRHTGQAMPDVDVQWETYAENLRDDVESWSPARDTGKIDYDMQDVVDSFVDFARTNPKMTGSELTAAFYRAEKPTASQRKKLNAAIANVGEPPRTATGGTRGQAMPDVGSFDEDAGVYLIAAGDGESLPVYQQADKRGKPAVDGTGKAKFVPIDYDLLHGPGITKYTGPGPEDATKPNYKGLAYDITQKGQREIDAAIDSGAVDSAANRVVDFTVEAMKNREIAAGKGW